MHMTVKNKEETLRENSCTFAPKFPTFWQNLAGSERIHSWEEKSREEDRFQESSIRYFNGNGGRIAERPGCDT